LASFQTKKFAVGNTTEPYGNIFDPASKIPPIFECRGGFDYINPKHSMSTALQKKIGGKFEKNV
jgi:hypothetical protein